MEHVVRSVAPLRFLELHAVTFTFCNANGRLGFEISPAGADVLKALTRDSMVWDVSAGRFIDVAATDNAVRLIWKQLRGAAAVVRSPSPEALELFREIEAWTASSTLDRLRERYGKGRHTREVPPLSSFASPAIEQKISAVVQLLPYCEGVTLWRFG